ncbi:MAG: aminoacetone oxidase family FAD-binding enzyme [Coriobacteriia bacterium]|nr:aminoacetone oxidase family FAD-binding enzyme [Coriobacteriia bacterium]
MPEPSVAIIGGGAAGLSAAIAAARLGAAVTLLEADTRVGRKILTSGNGRCNLSNLSVSPSAYNHPDFVEPVLSAHRSEDIRSFFGGMGLLAYADDEGRIYPVTNAAASVLEVLRLECARLGVEERLGFEVVSIAEITGTAAFEVSSRDGGRVFADAVVITTGGGGSLLTDRGHNRMECVPVLGPIKTDLEPIRGLTGVRVKCAASVLASSGEPIATERGELLFRDYGVSGIMIFDLSRFLDDGRVLSIDFFPEVASSEFVAMITERCAALFWRTAETFFDGMLHSRVARAVLRAARIDPKTPVAELPCERLAAVLKDFRVNILGRGDAKQAQVTRGGASVAGFDPNTMGSRHVAGLFAAGEVLDVDGRCGGFNLHWAWASGIVAGESAARFAAARAAGLDVPRGGSA